MDYLGNGHTYKDAIRELGVSQSSITKWRKMLRETGSLEDEAARRRPSKLPDGRLRAHVAAHPEAYFTEIAAHFNCSDEGVRKACKRLGITRKKKTRLYRERDEAKRQEFLDQVKDIPP